MSLESKRTEQALHHLKTLKPYDGWSHDTYLNSRGKQLVMLKRRNVPLTNTGYSAIALDNNSQCVIGVVSIIKETDDVSSCRGRVLVEKDGTVARDEREITVNLSKTVPSGSSVSGGRQTKEEKLKQEIERNRLNRERAREGLRKREHDNRQTAAVAAAPFSAENFMTKLSDEDTSQLAKLGLVFIAVVTILRIISSFKFAFNAIVLPLLILYAMQNCPANDTFDAKKELKRVLRGQHLPEGHQDKPAGDWLSRTVARVTASVAAEAATALGYEVSYFNMSGICTLATVDVPVMNLELYWIGAFGRWKYMYKTEKQLPQEHQ